ncbi:MAG: RNA methyltransferase [Acidobacteria bacterium]|nr:RNA methyltransferase [Acidobacteriota bacterium]
MPDELVITSRANAWFKRFREAIELHRDEIAVEGPKHVNDCIAAGWRPIAIAAREGTATSLPVVPRAIVFGQVLFRALSETVESQGLIALFARPTVSSGVVLQNDGTFVVLDGIQDPGNAGTIVRLAAAFGAAGVLTTEGTADLLSPKAIRASTGAALTVPTARIARAEIASLAGAGSLPLFAAVAGGGSLPRELPPRFALILGSEGRGISDELSSIATPVGVKMAGSVESLNVGAAAAILLWQIQNARGEELRS